MKHYITIILLIFNIQNGNAIMNDVCELRVVDKDNKPLNGVFCIYNDTILTSTAENRFLIDCNYKDTLIFEKTGYMTHTLILNKQALDKITIIHLEKIKITLPEVSVFGKYHLTSQMIANANHNVKIAVYQANQNNILSVMDDPSGYNLENIINSSGHHGISTKQSFSFSTKTLKNLKQKKAMLPQKRIISFEEYQSQKRDE